jgi:virginiamycin A acetyltransferase
MRDFLKGLANGLALVCVAPLLAWYGLLKPFLGRDRALEDVSQIGALIPGLAGQYLRRALFRRVLQACGRNTVIGFGVIFASADAQVGDRVYIGPYCTIGLAVIEDDVLIAAGAHVPSGARTHGIDGHGTAMRDQPGEPRCVRIGQGSWIGNAAVVMADVGCHCVIGAGAVVTRPIPDDMIAAGVPARILRRRGVTASPTH